MTVFPNERDGGGRLTILSAKLFATGVFIDWSWQGFSAHLDIIDIQVDRGQGWVPLVFDTNPGYTDTAPFPAALTKWK